MVKIIGKDKLKNICKIICAGQYLTIFAQDKLVSSITKEDFEPPTSPEDEVRTKKCCHFNICSDIG